MVAEWLLRPVVVSGEVIGVQPSSPMHELAALYFNEDWELSSPEPGEIVRSFARNKSRAEVQLVANEMVDLLAQDPGEHDLERFWSETLDSNFLPEYVGLTYREWFVRMLEILRAPHGS